MTDDHEGVLAGPMKTAAMVAEWRMEKIAETLAPYPNLAAIMVGTVSGSVTEWPAIRSELAALCVSFSETQSALAFAQSEIVKGAEKYEEAVIDRNETEAMRDKLRDILHRTAIALKGPEGELTRHSYHDLPEVAAGKVTYAVACTRALTEIRAIARKETEVSDFKAVYLMGGIADDALALKSSPEIVHPRETDADRAMLAAGEIPAHLAAPERSHAVVPKCEAGRALLEWVNAEGVHPNLAATLRRGAERIAYLEGCLSQGIVQRNEKAFHHLLSAVQRCVANDDQKALHDGIREALQISHGEEPHKHSFERQLNGEIGCRCGAQMGHAQGQRNG